MSYVEIQAQIDQHGKLIQDSRANLQNAYSAMIEYRNVDPGLYLSQLKTLTGLSAQQASLEEMYNQIEDRLSYKGNSGGLGNPLLIGAGIAASIIGLGTWALNQFVASKKFDQYQQCLREQEKLGIRGEAAARICSGKFPLIDISSGNLVMLALLALGLYFVFIKK